MIMEPCEEIDENAFALNGWALKNEKDLSVNIRKKSIAYKRN